MKPTPPFKLADLAKTYSKVAPHYDAAAFTQRAIGERLLDRLATLTTIPQQIIDVGSGSGLLTEQLQQRFPDSQIIGVDLALGMCHFAQNRDTLHTSQTPQFVCANAAHLPLKPQSIDLIFSNLTLHWCYPLLTHIQALHQVAKPEAEIFFATLGPQTLVECRESFIGVDDYQHVNPFYDLITLGNALQAAGFSEPVVDREIITVHYRDVMTLFQDLKATGAQNKHVNRNKGCMSKRQLQKAISNYEKFKQTDGLYPATYEVIFGHARKSAHAMYRTDSDGIVRIPGDHIPMR